MNQRLNSKWDCCLISRESREYIVLKDPHGCSLKHPDWVTGVTWMESREGLSLCQAHNIFIWIQFHSYMYENMNKYWVFTYIILDNFYTLFVKLYTFKIFQIFWIFYLLIAWFLYLSIYINLDGNHFCISNSFDSVLLNNFLKIKKFHRHKKKMGPGR